MKLWIARDKKGYLQIFDVKPCWDKSIWRVDVGACNVITFPFKSDEFPKVTFENSPQEVEIILNDEYKRLKEIETIYNEESDYGDKHYC